DVALGPLQQGAVSQLVGEMLGVERAPEALVRAIAEEAEGIPLFVVETLRELLNLARIVREPTGLWRWKDAAAGAALSDVPLPAKLAGLIERRLERLEPEARHAAQMASVLGEELGFGLLQKLTDLPEEPLLDCLDRLLKARIL